MISDVSLRTLYVPARRPLLNAALRIDGFYYVLVTVRDTDGLFGEGILFALRAGHARILAQAVTTAAEAIIGQDPSDSEKLWAEGRKQASFLGTSGVTIMALSALDGALWDLRGKRVGLSIACLLGRARTRIPVYASDGLWVGDDISTLMRDASAFTEAGFNAMKMRLSGDIDFDLPRIAMLRDAIGARGLMVDANEGMTRETALKLGRNLGDHDVAWFEEPLPAHDFEGAAWLTQRLDTPIAAGESLFGHRDFRDLIDKRSAYYLMPDLQRSGGVGEFLRIGALAAARGLPVSSHLFPEYSLQIMASLPTSHSVEYVSWTAPLFQETIEIKDGMALVPDRPGWGFTFNPNTIDQYKTE